MMKKRIISILLCLAMILTVLPASAMAVTAKGAFADVQDSTKYYYDAVLWAVDEEITDGVDDTHFAPDQTCTRGQVVTFLWRAAGEPTVAATNPFVDVKEDAYYYKAVLWAVDKGITDGMDDTHFEPDKTCTRGQVVTFLWRAAKSPSVNVTNPFKDNKSNQYYYSAVLWAVDEGITDGMDSTHFAPNQTCTRGQVVTFLYRHIKSLMISKEDAVVGSYITFGSYEQDNDTTNGAEPIEWRVLKVDGDKALVVSRYVLDCVVYDEMNENDENATTAWGYCSLRRWLNGPDNNPGQTDSFLYKAFTQMEQGLISKTTVTADENPSNTSTNQGYDPKDKLFILSMEEITNLTDHSKMTTSIITQNGQLKSGYPDAQCSATAYAVANGAYATGEYNQYCLTSDGKYATEYWTRTMGKDGKHAVTVWWDGQFYKDGTLVYWEGYGVRPAMWIELAP